jgi:hypothetical protein
MKRPDKTTRKLIRLLDRNILAGFVAAFTLLLGLYLSCLDAGISVFDQGSFADGRWWYSLGILFSVVVMVFSFKKRTEFKSQLVMAG